MGTELVGTEPGLVHYLRLNEGQGALAHDMVSNNDGIFFNLQPDSWVVSTAPLTQQPGPDCGDGVQNQGEVAVDCGGPCPPCPPLTETDCGDGTDEDLDGATDCLDPDCAGSPLCDAVPIASNDRDADYNPLEGVMLANFYSSAQICIGDDGGRSWQMGLQFRVDLPLPVTITTASIELTSSGDNTGSLTTEIRGVDQDDIAPFVAGTQPSFFDLYPLTAAAASWSPPAAAAGVTSTTPELQPILQEVVDRPGWVSGNHVGFVFSEPQLSPNWRCFRDFNAGDGSQAALSLDYYVNGSPVCLDARGPSPELAVFREPPGGCPQSTRAAARLHLG